MAALHNGHLNGDSGLPESAMATGSRFSDIPAAIDIPVAGGDTEEAVEVNLEDHLEDPTELCQLLENENAAKNIWVTISLAYAKQHQIDHAIDILDKGLVSLSRSAPKERLSLLGCKAWLDLMKSRSAPRVFTEGELTSEAKTKDHYLREATSAINDALRINPSFPPLDLTRGVLFLLKASLQVSGRAGVSAGEAQRIENLKQAQRCFEDALKSSGGRNMMAVMGRARTQYLLGKYAEALQSYQEVLGKMPSLTDPDPRIGVGCCLWQLGFHERAKMAWERSLSLSPMSKVAHALLGIYYLHEAAKYPAGAPEFSTLYKIAMQDHTRKAYTIDKDFPLACATFASYFLLTGRYDSVEPLARRANNRTDINAIASDGWYLMARKEHNLGDLQKAAEYYNLSDVARGGAEKGYLPAKFGSIQTMIQSHDLDSAKFKLERMLQSAKSPEATTLLGCLYAEEVFAASTSPNKEDKSVEMKKAIGYLESIRKSWPTDEKTSRKKGDESILLYLARLYEADYPAESMKCLQEVEELQLDKIAFEFPPDPNTTTPEDLAQHRTQLRPYLPPQLLNNIGCFYYSSEKYEDAQITFEIALNACVKLTEKQEDERQAAEAENLDLNELDIKDINALVTTTSYNLGRTYEALGMLPDAQKVYEGILAQHTDYTDASARLAYLALRASPQDEGPRKIQALYHTDYGNTEVRALMGWYHGRSKKKTMNVAEDQEHRHYKHTLQGYDKHDKYALTGMGNIYLMVARDMPRNTDTEREKRSKMYQKAVEFFDKALQLDSKNAYAAQGIAIALCDDKRNFSEAVQIFAKIKDTVRDASVHTNLGHVYAELRQYGRSIEAYEKALKTDGRGENPLLLACLSRSWLLKGKAEKLIEGLNMSLSYMKRALAVQPDSVHLQFNIAFLQFQVAQLVHSMPDDSRTLDDVKKAAQGLEEAIVTFGEVAKVKAPPYPRSALEQRAAMAKNTMRKQLERAEAQQRQYEHDNADKLRAAKDKRDAELQRRKDEIEKRRLEEAGREEKMREERRKIIEKTEQMAERARAEAAERDGDRGAESDDSAGGKKRGRGRGGKRGKKRDRGRELEDGFIEDDGDGDEEGLFGGAGDTGSDRLSATGDENSQSRSRPPREKPKRKKRKLERKGVADRAAAAAAAAGGRSSKKYKSEAVVVDSDSDEEASAVVTPAANGTDDGEEDEEMRDSSRHRPSQGRDDGEDETPRRPAARLRKQLRTIADDDDDEEEGTDDDADGGVGLNGGNAPTPLTSGDGNDDDE